MKKKKWVYILFISLILIITAVILILVFAFPPPELTAPSQAYTQVRESYEAKTTNSIEETNAIFLGYSDLSAENKAALNSNKNILDALLLTDSFLQDNLVFMERTKDFNDDANSVNSKKDEFIKAARECQSYIDGTLEEFFKADTKSTEDKNAFCKSYLEKVNVVVVKYVDFYNSLAKVVSSSSIMGYAMNSYSKSYLTSLGGASLRVLDSKAQSSSLLATARLYSVNLGTIGYGKDASTMIKAFDDIAKVEVSQ